MPQPHRQSTKLRDMIMNIKTKVLIKFGTSGMLREELRAKKLRNVYYIIHAADCMENTHTQKSPIPCPLFRV